MLFHVRFWHKQIELVLHRDEIELILEILATEFDSLAAINSWPDYVSLDELESLLLTQEARIWKTNKEVIEVVSVNLTQGVPQPQNPQTSEMNDTNPFNMPTYGFGGRGRGNRGGRFRGCGAHSGNRNFFQCQICYKPGHDASSFYYFRTQDPYGIPPAYGNLGMHHQSNVWTQPGYRAPNSISFSSPRPVNPSMQSQSSIHSTKASSFSCWPWLLSILQSGLVPWFWSNSPCHPWCLKSRGFYFSLVLVKSMWEMDKVWLLPLLVLWSFLPIYAIIHLLNWTIFS